jgi:hypothetical protein
MAERISDLLEVMNYDLGVQLSQWRQYQNHNERDRAVMAARMNTMFYLAEKAKLNITLEVKKEAIIRKKGDYFTTISPQEAAVYGEEREHSWIFKITSGDPALLSADDDTLIPHLVYIHKHHGTIAKFRPTDVISITLS